jgi:hypothetical protein
MAIKRRNAAGKGSASNKIGSDEFEISVRNVRADTSDAHFQFSLAGISRRKWHATLLPSTNARRDDLRADDTQLPSVGV